MNEITYSSIILRLFDHVVRQVDKAKIVRNLLIALNTLFLTKTLPDKIYPLKKVV